MKRVRDFLVEHLQESVLLQVFFWWEFWAVVAGGVFFMILGYWLTLCAWLASIHWVYGAVGFWGIFLPLFILAGVLRTRERPGH